MQDRGKKTPAINRRRFIGGLCGAAAGTSLWTWLWEPHWVDFNKRSLPIRNLPEKLIGARMAQISDIHIGPQVSDNFLRETFQQIAQLRPEFAVYTGDFTSYEAATVKHATEIFPLLPKGNFGTYGILGNHDYGVNWRDYQLADQLSGIAQDCGIRILRNEVEEVEGMQIAGLDDLWAKRFDPGKTLHKLDHDGACIALSHNPDSVDLPGWEQYSGWILAGHTHGGQCKPPFLPAPLLPVKNRLYTAGAFELTGGRRLYINRGLGHLLKVRFNARPEVTVFELNMA
ncbi:MAG: metallophosphoesterase [Verrucomicrobiales bacterium]